MELQAAVFKRLRLSRRQLLGYAAVGAAGGVFVTGSGYNPTLTIIAVALRTAASMI